MTVDHPVSRSAVPYQFDNHVFPTPSTQLETLTPSAAANLASFQAYLRSSKRILALVGAGLSASSGLPTFRGTGGLWRNYDAMELATPEAFSNDPSLVWQFYSARRAAALQAMPNKAHYALAELAKRMPDFLTLTQNVDGLSTRANHPPNQLLHLHGSLFSLKCTSFYCDFQEDNHFTHPLTPELAIASEISAPYAHIPLSGLPHCPKCHTGLLRPGVVWFGEALPWRAVKAADDFISAGKVDLILVIGTSGTVYPAAGYVDRIRMQGGKVAVFNIDIDDSEGEDDFPEMEPERSYANRTKWTFEGDAAEWVPVALEPIIGPIEVQEGSDGERFNLAVGRSDD
ncbi:DHS-like NAD/FAD-binding domain-containing protein [Lipomyces doorenjongii]|uniref:DHS-like NAD/FAD-binding domain-containing protein n=1 Tax=Lipomyces doorenjongii TaxID=383834 RepID=UPI0034CD8684